MNDKNLVSKNENNSVVLYQDEDGITRVDVRFSNEDVWLNQEQLAEIYRTSQQNISQHISNIYADEELEAVATHKKILLVRQEGNRKVKSYCQSRAGISYLSRKRNEIYGVRF